MPKHLNKIVILSLLYGICFAFETRLDFVSKNDSIANSSFVYKKDIFTIKVGKKSETMKSNRCKENLLNEKIKEIFSSKSISKCQRVGTIKTNSAGGLEKDWCLSQANPQLITIDFLRCQFSK